MTTPIILKLEEQYINLRNVSDFFDTGEALYVTFARDDEDGGYYLRFEGAKANALRAWLDNNSVSLTPETPEDKAYEEYRAKGGLMTREVWGQMWRGHIQHISEGRISPYEKALRL